MDDTWFESKIAPDGKVENGCHPDEAKALKDYLTKKTSAQEAAQAIMKPIANSEDPGNDLWRLWCLLMDALVDVEQAKVPKLICLLVAIQQLPEPNLTDLQKWHLEKGFLYRDLPKFAWNWADEHDQDLCRSTWADSSPTDHDSLRAQYVRSAEVEARLAVEGVGGITLDWGYEYIAEALEQNDAVAEYELPAVGKWITIAGEQLFAGAVEGRETWAFMRKRDLGWEAKTMSLERWRFWVKCMEKLHGQQSRHTKAATKVAIRRMKALEASSVRGSKKKHFTRLASALELDTSGKGKGAIVEHIEHI